MRTTRTAPRDIDEYIADFPRDIQEILEKIRMTIRKAAPKAEEAIKYQIPNTDVYLEREFDSFCSFQQTYRTVSDAERN